MQAARGDAHVAVGGVPRRGWRWLWLQPVLRSLPRLAQHHLADHAPDARAGGEAVCRLRRVGSLTSSSFAEAVERRPSINAVKPSSGCAAKQVVSSTWGAPLPGSLKL